MAFDLNTIKVEDDVKSLGVKIEAARSGRMNGNLCFYTPKAMDDGIHTFLKPFAKHLQSKHNGEALGPITEVEYVPELFPNASPEFISTINTLKAASEASDGVALVKAVKDLMAMPEYKDPDYRGLGIANIYADIYDPEAIINIKTQNDFKGTVSIGGKSSEVYCSVCSERYTDDHEHKKGITYDGQLCFHIHNDLFLDHCGFVAVPADKLTNTQVLDEDLGFNITHMTKEPPMLLEQIKEAVKDVSAVKQLIAETVTDEAKQAKAFEAYEASLKNSRSNHYLISADKLLNLRTPFGIAVAEALVAKMAEDDENREYLSATIEKAKAVLNIQDTAKALEDALKDPEVEKPQETPTEPTESDIEKTEGVASTETTPPEATTVQDAQQELLTAIASLLDEKLAGFVATQSTKVQDSQADLVRELSGLRAQIDADEATLNALQSNYKGALIELIVNKKGTVSEAYRDKLASRTIDELKLTLEDLEEATVEHITDTEATPELQPTTKQEAITQIEDSQKEDLAATTPVEDAVDPQLWLSQRIDEVGFKDAIRDYQRKFKS